MARFTRLEVLTAMLRVGVTPIFHERDVDRATGTLHALAEGEARLVEFTNRGTTAHDVFASLERTARESLPSVILGAGSVLDVGTASHYINLGASFIVSPTFDAAVACLCNRRRIAYLPGCGTATEVAVAEEHGCDIIKLFPGNAAGGPAFISAVLGPSPASRLMPTGGVDPTEASLREWFDAGAACVGIGSQLVPPHEVASGSWRDITDRMREVRQFVDKVRPEQQEFWG